MTDKSDTQKGRPIKNKMDQIPALPEDIAKAMFKAADKKIKKAKKKPKKKPN